jgi:hypothetical protein
MSDFDTANHCRGSTREPNRFTKYAWKIETIPKLTDRSQRKHNMMLSKPGLDYQEKLIKMNAGRINPK